MREVQFGEAIVEVGWAFDQYRVRLHSLRKFAHEPRARRRVVSHGEEHDASGEVAVVTPAERAYAPVDLDEQFGFEGEEMDLEMLLRRVISRCCCAG